MQPLFDANAPKTVVAAGKHIKQTNGLARTNAGHELDHLVKPGEDE